MTEPTTTPATDAAAPKAAEPTAPKADAKPAAAPAATQTAQTPPTPLELVALMAPPEKAAEAKAQIAAAQTKKQADAAPAAPAADAKPAATPEPKTPEAVGDDIKKLKAELAGLKREKSAATIAAKHGIDPDLLTATGLQTEEELEAYATKLEGHVAKGSNPAAASAIAAAVASGASASENPEAQLLRIFKSIKV